MDPPNWTEIIGLLAILLGWAEFIRRVLEARKRPKRKRKSASNKGNPPGCSGQVPLLQFPHTEGSDDDEPRQDQPDDLRAHRSHPRGHTPAVAVLGSRRRCSCRSCRGVLADATRLSSTRARPTKRRHMPARCSTRQHKLRNAVRWHARKTTNRPVRLV